MKRDLKPEGLLSLWLTNIHTDAEMGARLARWGISKGQLAAFLAGREEIPYGALMTVAADTGITSDQLLKDYGIAASLSIPEPSLLTKPARSRVIRYRTARAVGAVYVPEDFVEPVTLRALDRCYVAPLGKTEVPTGLAFGDSVVVEFLPNTKAFPRNHWVLSMNRDSRGWGYITVEVA